MTELLQATSPVETTAANNATVQDTNINANVDKPVENVNVNVDPAKSIIDSLAPEFKEIKSLANFKDINDLAKSYVNLNSLLGKKVSEWAATDIKGLNSKLGKPESADKYILPDDLGEEKGIIQALAFDADLNQDQAKKLSDKLILARREENEKASVAKKQSLEKTTVELRKEFGEAFDQRLALANRALDKLGGDELKKTLAEAGLLNNASVIKMFANMGKNYLEEHTVVGVDKASVHGITPSDAKTIMNAKMLDKEFREAYYSATHPAHKAAVDEMNKLIQMSASS